MIQKKYIADNNIYNILAISDLKAGNKTRLETKKTDIKNRDANQP
jgi:hypothetical protein